MTTTLTIDCGGGGLKASVVDENDVMLAPAIRVPTPYPLPPDRFLEELAHFATQLPAAERITVGMPGMIRHGIVVTTPHYMTVRGPGSPVDPALRAAWTGLDMRSLVQRAFGLPALVLNDAEVAGAALVKGEGLELVITLGTGLGNALFDDGRLAPHLELSQATIRRGRTYDNYIGELQRRRLGSLLWSRRVVQMVYGLRPVFVWDRLFLGGRNSQLIDARSLAKLGTSVTIVPNAAGILGGSRAWTLMS
ncbi:MAG TPA: ROK family protein [Micromonosporaceae bacterium]